MSDVEVRPVTADLWPELERFFGPRGAYANCWCAFFRVRSKEFEAGCRDKGAGNKLLMRRLTLDNQVPGLLAFRDQTPIGWVSVAPRDQFARVLNSRLLRPPEPPDPTTDDAVWSVVCFWAPKQHRGQGVADVLLEAAVDYAYAHGANVIEGYPVDTSKNWPGIDAIYHGTVGLFERAGFVAVRHPNERRAVMRHARKPKTRTTRNQRSA